MALDVRGKIAAAQLAFYVPVAIVSLIFFIRYLFRNDAGWFFLLLFALRQYQSILRNIPYVLYSKSKDCRGSAHCRWRNSVKPKRGYIHHSISLLPCRSR